MIRRLTQIFMAVTGLVLLAAAIGHAMLQGLATPFPFDQDDPIYRLWGEVNQFGDPDQVAGRDFMPIGGLGPTWILAKLAWLSFPAVENTAAIASSLGTIILYFMLTLLFYWGLYPLWTTGKRLLLAMSGSLLVMLYTHLPQKFLPLDDGMLLFASFLPFVLWPLTLRLNGKHRKCIIASVLWFPCLLWPVDFGLATLAFVLLAQLRALITRPLHLILAVLVGIGVTTRVLWTMTHGHIPEAFGRVVAQSIDSFWLHPPYDPASRYWALSDILTTAFHRDGLITGSLLIGLAAALIKPDRIWTRLIGLLLILMLGGYAREWLHAIDELQLLPARMVAAALVVRIGVMAISSLRARMTISGRYTRLYPPGMIILLIVINIIAIAVIIRPMPERFDMPISIDHARCLFHNNCAKPVADRSAVLIEGLDRWMSQQLIPISQKIVSAFPTWIDVKLGGLRDLPGVQASYVSRSSKQTWIAALEKRQYQMAVTESAGIFDRQPWMIHQLWWFYRQIMQDMLPIHNDYRYVFWLRREEPARFSPSLYQCTLVDGNHGDVIIMPHSDAELADGNKRDRLYEVRFRWSLDQPAPDRLLVTGNKPGLFVKTSGFSLDPHDPLAVIPLRESGDFVQISAFAPAPLNIHISECSIWQIDVPGADQAIWGQ